MKTTKLLLRQAGELLLDAVFPPRCAGCRDWSKPLFCAACAPLVEPIAPPFCARCGIPYDPLAYGADICADCRDNRYHGPPAVELLRSVYTFSGPLREAVHRFKYQDKTALAEPLGELMHAFLLNQSSDKPPIPITGIAMLVPVPLHGWRRYRRGYNQSELLARSLGKLLSLPVEQPLRRTRHTAPQVKLSRKERQQNVRGAFTIDIAKLERSNTPRRPVLLIDDVCTTGATLNECAAVLKKAGVKQVYALTLARQL